MFGLRNQDALERYTLPTEHVVIQMRQHWVVLTRPVLGFVAATALTLWADFSVPIAQGEIVRVLSLLWLGVGAWAAWRVLDWRYSTFVATDRRLLLFHGFITKQVSMMPLIKVTDLTYHRSVMGLMLGYGKFILESAGQDQALSTIEFVPHPDANYQVICAQLFGTGSDTPQGKDADTQDDIPPARGHRDERGDDGGARREPVAPHERGQSGRGPGRFRGGSPTGDEGIRDAPHAIPTGRFPGQRRPEYIGQNAEAARRRRRKADTGPIPIRRPGDDT